MEMLDGWMMWRLCSCLCDILGSSQVFSRSGGLRRVSGCSRVERDCCLDDRVLDKTLEERLALCQIWALAVMRVRHGSGTGMGWLRRARV